VQGFKVVLRRLSHQHGDLADGLLLFLCFQVRRLLLPTLRAFSGLFLPHRQTDTHTHIHTHTHTHTHTHMHLMGIILFLSYAHGNTRSSIQEAEVKHVIALTKSPANTHGNAGSPVVGGMRSPGFGAVDAANDLIARLDALTLAGLSATHVKCNPTSHMQVQRHMSMHLIHMSMYLTCMYLMHTQM
jgi:hypothetical protein